MTAKTLRGWTILFSGLLPAFGPSCAAPVESPERVADDDEVAAAPEDDVAPEDATSASTEPLVPTAAFPSLDALCRAQEVLVAPQLVGLSRYGHEGEEIPLEPACRPSPDALATTRIALRAPFLEVGAVTVETGYALSTFVVARTAEGWRAIPQPAQEDYHGDPGCFSIERDAGVVAVEVLGDARPALVLTTSSTRGTAMEEHADGRFRSWSENTHRATACRVEPEGAFACDPAAVVRISVEPDTATDGRRATVRFETEYAVDPDGHLHAKAEPPEVLDDAP